MPGMTPETFVRLTRISLDGQSLKNGAVPIGFLWRIAGRAILLAVVVGAWFLPSRGEVAAEGARPNIVLIMADDMGFSDI